MIIHIPYISTQDLSKTKREHHGNTTGDGNNRGPIMTIYSPPSMTEAFGSSDGSWSSWWFGFGIFLLARRDAGT